METRPPANGRGHHLNPFDPPHMCMNGTGMFSIEYCVCAYYNPTSSGQTASQICRYNFSIVSCCPCRRRWVGPRPKAAAAMHLNSELDLRLERGGRLAPYNSVLFCNVLRIGIAAQVKVCRLVGIFLSRAFTLESSEKNLNWSRNLLLANPASKIV